MSDWRRDVLAYWFGLDPEQWWRSGAAVDEEIRKRFLKLWAEKRELPVGAFLDDSLTALAAVILFDQFPRNMFRGEAEQFATDHLALGIASAAVNRGLDDSLKSEERSFLYMPFEHSESLADQQRSLQLFTALGDDYLLGFAKKHHDVIERFGRFPHRNAMLGRAPRPAEVAAGDVFPLVSGLVELARFGRPYQAELARLFIESYGLTAVVFDTENQGYSDGAIIGVRLMVLEEELEEARAALAEYRP